MQETTRYILDKHFAYYLADMKNITNQFKNCQQKDLVFITVEYLTPYLTFVKENQQIFKVSIKHFNSLNMGYVYEKMFEHIFNPILDRFNVLEKERTYLIKFYLTGVFAIVMEWLDKNCSDDMQTVIDVIIDCVLGERSING